MTAKIQNKPGAAFPRIARRAALAATILLWVLLAEGCYVLHQGSVLLSYRQRAVSIDELAKKPDTPEDTKLFIDRVKAIKAFSVDRLGLDDDDNYTLYVDLDRDYLAAVVSAAERTSFKRHEWWFPIVGDVPYKGFFDPEDAKKEAEKLKSEDLDVWIRRVDAFSTLGYFSDPLYSFMKKYRIDRMAELIIHEQTHAAVYLKGEAQFNEELATFVGKEGARQYIIHTFGEKSGEFQTMEESEADSRTFILLLKSLVRRLEEVYNGSLPRDEKLLRKKEIIEEFKNEFQAKYAGRFKTKDYLGFPRLPVNNAYLSIYQLYTEGDGWFEDLYERSGRDLPKFIAAARTLEGKKGDPKKLFREALGIHE